MRIGLSTNSVYIVLAALVAGLFVYGSQTMLNMGYFPVLIFLGFRHVQNTPQERARLTLLGAYLVVLAMQVVFFCRILMDFDIGDVQPRQRWIAMLILVLPMAVSRYTTTGKRVHAHMPSPQGDTTISFAQIRESAGSIRQAMATLEKTGERLTLRNFKLIAEDLPRHDSFHYVNADSLSPAYFRAAQASLSDPNLYIVISDTGTPASEVLSVFTQRQFNHASLAFDAELQTIVSYNGGERVYPPGLNREMLAFFRSKPDASILVYRLPVTCAQKKAALDKIAQINREGSAYNLLGLLVNQSYKPNIMYCSQFVYNILDHIGASYFVSPGVIKPTDLIEKDYRRKLVFVEEVMLGADDIRQ